MSRSIQLGRINTENVIDKVNKFVDNFDELTEDERDELRQAVFVEAYDCLRKHDGKEVSNFSFNFSNLMLVGDLTIDVIEHPRYDDTTVEMLCQKLMKDELYEAINSIPKKYGDMILGIYIHDSRKELLKRYKSSHVNYMVKHGLRLLRIHDGKVGRPLLSYLSSRTDWLIRLKSKCNI